MAKPFVLTTQLQIQIPNLNQVVSQLNKGLGNVNVPVNINIPKNANTQLTNLNKNVKNAGASARSSAKSFDQMRNSLRGALTYIAKYDAAREIFNLFAQTVRDGVSSAIAFEKEMVKVSQVTGRTMKELKGVEREITRIATTFGVSSGALVKTQRVLAQTGMSAKDAKIALEALAKTTLAATFDDIASTTETAIAGMRQFGIASTDLEKTLGKINSLAASFAVEAGDIGVAIRRAGGAFKAAGGSLDELNAMFTAVRSTTRETAETIATGFRTIFTRIQRPKTIQFLKQLGVQLQDLQGNFVGPFEAVRKLNIALKDLDPRDVRYSQIIEQLGGFRQVSKVIPLIQQFGQAQKALNVSQQGGTSLSKDAAKAQQSLAVQLAKVKEEYQALFREIFGGQGMQTVIKTTLKLASAFARVADSLAPIIPLIATIGAAKLGQFALFGSLGRGRKQGGRINKFATGGVVPGQGNSDSVPAMLTPGEFVIRKSSVKAIGANRLQKMNRYAGGGPVQGPVSGPANTSKGVKRKYNVNENGITDGYKGNIKITSFNKGKRSYAGVSKEADKLYAIGQEEYKKGISNKLTQKAALENARRQIEIRGKLKPNSANSFFGKPLKKFFNQNASSKKGSMSYLRGAIHERNSYKYLTSQKTKGVKKLDDQYGADFSVITGRGKTYVEAKTLGSSRASQNKIIAKALLAKAGSASPYKQSPAQFDDVNLGNIEFVQAPKDAKSSGLSIPRTKKANRGGGISGTDTVPALLTPGEFVVNRKSAAKIGYGNLNNANRFGKTPKGFAAGGIVGPQKFNNGGEAKGGRLGLGAFIAIQTILPQLAEAFKSADGEVTDLSMGLDAASQALMTFAALNFATGDLLEGFGSKTQFAAKGMLAVGAAAFAAYQFEKQRGQEREKNTTKQLDDGGFRNQTSVNALRREFVSAREQQTVGASERAGQIGGAGLGALIVGGAIKGAVAGAGAGPVGVIVAAIGGAVVGGIAGYFAGGALGRAVGNVNFDKAGAVREFNDKVRALKLGVGIEDLTSALKAFSEGKASIGSIAAVVQGGIRNLEKGFTQISSAEGLESFQGQLKNTLPALTEYVQKVTNSANSFQELQTIVGADTLNTFSQLSGVSLPALQKQIQANVEQRRKSTAAQKANIAAIQATNQVLYRARDSVTGFDEIERRLKTFDNVLNGVASSIDNTFSTMSIGQIAPNFDDITNIFDMSSFSAQVDSLSSLFGQSGQALGQDVKNFTALNSLLPNILTEAAGQIGISGARASEIIERKLIAADPGGIIGAEFRRVIAQRVQAIAEMGEGGEGKFANRIRTDIDGVVRDLTKGMSETAEAFKRAAEFVDNANRRLASVYGLRTQLEMKIANQLSTIIGLQASNLERLAQAQRRDIAPEQQQNTFNNQQNALLTGTSIAGLGSNINVVANTFNRLKQRIKESDAAIANLGVSADSSGEVLENNRALIDENARLKSEFAKTKQVLENYANVQARVGRIQEEIANAQKKKDAARSLAQDFAFGTNQDRRNLFRDLQAASVAAAQGLDAIPQQLRGNVLSILQQIPDSPVFAGGQTGQEVTDKIINDQLKYMPANMRKMLAAIFKDGATEEQRFIKRLSQIQDEAVKAQQAFLQGMHGDSKNLKESIARLNEALTNDLRKIFAEQENRALAREVGENKGVLASSKAQLEQLKKIQSAGIPVQNPAVLQAVRANVDGIKALKEAREKQAKFGTAADESFRAVDRAGFAAAGDQGSARANERAIRNLGTYFRNRFGVEVGNQLTQSARDALGSFLAANPNASAAEVAQAVSDGVQGFALEREGTAQSIIEEQMKRLNLAGLGPYVNTLIKNVDGISTALSSLPPEATWQSLNESIVKTTTTINNANASIAANNAGGPVRRAAGGGIFAPHGTDTVPAMLTPGEFVVNKKAAQNNMGALKSLNSGKTQYLAGGGEVKIGNFLSTNVGDEKLDPKDFNKKRDEAARLLSEHHKRYATGGGTGSVFDQATRYLAKKYIDGDMQGLAKDEIKKLDTGKGIEMGVGQYKEPNLRKYYSGAIANLPLAVANYMEKGFLGVNGFSYGNVSGIDTLDDYRRGYFAYINRNGVADSKDGGNLSSGHKLKDSGYDQISKLQVMAGSNAPGSSQARGLYTEMQQWADNAMSAYGKNGANVGGAFSFKFRKGKVDDYTNDETGMQISGFDFPVIKPQEIAVKDNLGQYFTGTNVGDNKLSVRATGFKEMNAASEVSSQALMSVPVGMLDPLYKTMERYLFSTGANYGYTVKDHLGKNTQKIKDATKNKQWGFYDEVWRSIWPDKWKRPDGYNYLDEPMAQFGYMASQIDKSLTTTERQLAKSSPFDVTDPNTWAKAFSQNGPSSSLRGIGQSREKAIQQALNWFSQDGFKDFGGKADEARFFGKAMQAVGNELGFTTAGIDAAGLLGIANDAGAQGLNEEERIKKKVEDIQIAKGGSKGLPVDGVGGITTVVRQVIESMKKNRDFTRIPQYAKGRSSNLKKYRDFYKVKNWGSKDSRALFPWLSQFGDELQRMMNGGLIAQAKEDSITLNDNEMLRQLTRIQDARNKNEVINEQVMGVQNFAGKLFEVFLGGGSLLDRMVTFGTTGANSWYRTKFDNEFPFYKTFGLTKVPQHVGDFQKEVQRSFNNVAKLYQENKRNEKPPVKLATGGRVPQRLASGGGVSSFTPHGTDTVPAMLTPGEFVVNKQAAQANMPLLQSINGGGGAKTSGGTQYLASGGMVAKDIENAYLAVAQRNAGKTQDASGRHITHWPPKIISEKGWVKRADYYGGEGKAAIRGWWIDDFDNGGELTKVPTQKNPGDSTTSGGFVAAGNANLTGSNLSGGEKIAGLGTGTGSFALSYAAKDDEKKIQKKMKSLTAQGGFFKLLKEYTDSPLYNEDARGSAGANVSLLKDQPLFEEDGGMGQGPYYLQEVHKVGGSKYASDFSSIGYDSNYGAKLSKLVYDNLSGFNYGLAFNKYALVGKYGEDIFKYQYADWADFPPKKSVGELLGLTTMNPVKIPIGEMAPPINWNAYSAAFDASSTVEGIMAGGGVDYNTLENDLAALDITAKDYENSFKEVARGSFFMKRRIGAGGIHDFYKTTKDLPRITARDMAARVTQTEMVKNPFNKNNDNIFKLIGNQPSDDGYEPFKLDKKIFDILLGESVNHIRENLAEQSDNLDQSLTAKRYLTELYDNLKLTPYPDAGIQKDMLLNSFASTDAAKQARETERGMAKSIKDRIKRYADQNGQNADALTLHNGSIVQKTPGQEYIGWLPKSMWPPASKTTGAEAQTHPDLPLATRHTYDPIKNPLELRRKGLFFGTGPGDAAIDYAFDPIANIFQSAIAFGEGSYRTLVDENAGQGAVDKVADLKLARSKFFLDNVFSVYKEGTSAESQAMATRTATGQAWDEFMQKSGKRYGNYSGDENSDIENFIINNLDLVGGLIKGGANLSGKALKSRAGQYLTGQVASATRKTWGGISGYANKFKSQIPSRIAANRLEQAKQFSAEALAKADKADALDPVSHLLTTSETTTDLRGALNPPLGVQHSANNPIRQNAIANYNKANPEAMVSNFDDLPAWAKRDAVNAETAARKLGNMRDSLGTFFKKMTETDKSVIKGGVTADALSVNPRTGVSTPYKKTPFQDADAMSDVVSKADADAAIEQANIVRRKPGSPDFLGAGMDRDEFLKTELPRDTHFLLPAGQVPTKDMLKADLPTPQPIKEFTPTRMNVGTSPPAVKPQAPPVIKPPKPATKPGQFTPEAKPPIGGTVDLDAKYVRDASGNLIINRQAQANIKSGRYQKTNRGWTDRDGIPDANGLNPVVPDSAIYTPKTKVTAGKGELESIVLPTEQGMPFKSRTKVGQKAVEKAGQQLSSGLPVGPYKKAFSNFWAWASENKPKQMWKGLSSRWRKVRDAKITENYQKAVKQGAKKVQAGGQTAQSTQVAPKSDRIADNFTPAVQQHLADLKLQKDRDAIRLMEEELLNMRADWQKGVDAGDPFTHPNFDVAMGESMASAIRDARINVKAEIQRITDNIKSGKLTQESRRGIGSKYGPMADDLGPVPNEALEAGLGRLDEAAGPKFTVTDSAFPEWSKIQEFEFKHVPKGVDKLLNSKNLLKETKLNLKRLDTTSRFSEEGSLPLRKGEDIKDDIVSFIKEANRLASEATPKGIGTHDVTEILKLRGDMTTLGGKYRNILLDKKGKAFNKSLSKKQIQDFSGGMSQEDAIKFWSGVGRYADGGVVSYFSGGGPSMGTDTVPAMLTPGEFVVRKAAVDSVGIETLRAINNMGKGSTSSKPKKRAGVNYLANGGEGEATGMRMPTLDVRDFNMAISKFDSSVDRLEKIFGNGIQMTHNFEDMNVIVTVNGNFGDDDGELSNGMQRRINKEVRKGINDFIDRSFPDIPRMDIA